MNEADETNPMKKRGRASKTAYERGWGNPEEWSDSGEQSNFPSADYSNEIPPNTRQNGAMGTSRKKIEEYFERKRLEEVLDEKVEDNIFDR